MIDIYGIYRLSDGVLLYIGESERGIEDRKIEHLKSLQKGRHTNKTLQKLYDACDGNVEVRLISQINTDNSLIKYVYEACYNSKLKPLANKCIIAQGRNRIILKRVNEYEADELISTINRITSK